MFLKLQAMQNVSTEDRVNFIRIATYNIRSIKDKLVKLDKTLAGKNIYIATTEMKNELKSIINLEKYIMFIVEFQKKVEQRMV